MKITQERKLDIWMFGVIKMGTIRYDGINPLDTGYFFSCCQPWPEYFGHKT